MVGAVIFLSVGLQGFLLQTEYNYPTKRWGLPLVLAIISLFLSVVSCPKIIPCDDSKVNAATADMEDTTRAD